jgi:predicted PurR-regulated permease PerM
MPKVMGPKVMGPEDRPNFRQLQQPLARRPSGNVVITTIAIVAALQFGQDVFLPLAIAMLITFALSPLVTRLRGFELPMIASVLAAVTLAFAVIGMFVLVVAGQVAELAQELPTFQGNIVKKLEALQDTGPENGLVARLSRMVAEINGEMAKVVPEAGSANGVGGPLAVEVVQNRGAFETLRDLVLPLISPVATAGLVIVVVVFMLLERDELRDRFIRLVGANDINRTTQVIEDAGTKVGTYLLIQLLVNVIYAVPIGIGLMVIGVPNAMLWGMLTLVLRFLPYIGPILAAVFPLFLAFAVSPDWSMVIWTGALFLSVEMLSSNVIEPWLYGSRTGVSPLAIIISAIFWTWVWGPLGLVLSTPLTVCLVVVGRYIPQFEAFDVLFGDRPTLAAHSRLYQRLLVGDTVESTLRAEELLEEDFIADYHRDVGIPAVLLAQADYARGVLSQDQLTRFADAAEHLLAELDPVVMDELAETHAAISAQDASSDDLPETDAKTGFLGAGRHLVVLGGRTRLDDIAAGMLGQAAASEGAQVTLLSHADLTPSRFGRVTGLDTSCVLLNFLDTAPSRASLLHIRRLKRAAPHMRVGLVLWQTTVNLNENDKTQRVSKEKLAEIIEIGADFCATSMEEALASAFQDTAPRAATEPAKKAKSRVARMTATRGPVTSSVR